MRNFRLRFFLQILTVIIGIYAYGTTWYVSKDGSDSNSGTSWDQSFLTIKKPLTDAASEDQIWVAAGIYQEGSTVFIPEGVSLYGGFFGTEELLTEREQSSSHTIIDGMNSYRSVSNNGLIDGFCIINGRSERGGGIYNRGSVSSCNIYGNEASSYAGGVFNDYGSIADSNIYSNESKDKAGGMYSRSGTVSLCNIYGNSAFNDGGGVKNYYGTISSCKVYENSSSVNGGGIDNELGTITSCEIFGNTAYYGGGINDDKGTVSSCKIYSNIATQNSGGIKTYLGTISQCEVYENKAVNYGGGISNMDGSVSYCIVYQNRVHGFYGGEGGGIYNSGSVDSSLIYDNYAGKYGGGIYCTGEIINCTIVANEAADAGCGVFLDESSGKMSNSIIWNNEANDVNNNTNVSYCCYREADGTNGNILTNPLFANIEGESDTWDFHLRKNSPCIDSGTSPEGESNTDLDGILRPKGNGMDMGGYEYSDAIRAIFFCDRTTGKSGDEFQFTDVSYGSPDSWQWDFNGDGTIDSTEQSPMHAYSIPGTYSVSLTVLKNGESDLVTKKDYILVETAYLYVKSDGDDANDGKSWDNAVVSISKAVELAQPYNHIWVASGIYQEGDTITVPENISLYGGFAGNESDLMERDLKNNRTIIDGMKTYGCIYNFGRVDGFCITNGYCNNGAGIYNDHGIVTSCDVYKNSSLSVGGGIFNNAGSIGACKVFENDTCSSGGGIYNSGGSVADCYVYANCAFQFEGGGIMNWRGTIDSCVVFDNYADSNGGGICCSEGKINRCTITGNHSGMGGGGVSIFHELAEMTNSIIWNNDSYDVSWSSGSRISYCCYRGADGTSGNISDDPLFVNTENDPNTWDLHLKAGSPCIDSGSLSNTDMGAYEYSDSLRAIFYSDIAIGQPGDSFVFTDASNGNPDSWQWDFNGDGETDSTEQNPSYVYSESGIYSVSLTVSKDDASNTFSKIKSIGIYNGKVLYVKPDGNDLNDGMSWEDGLRSIDYTTKIAEPFDQIWVAAGTYNKSYGPMVVFSNINIYGGFFGNEMLMDERDVEQNQSIIESYGAWGCIYNRGNVDGFTITNGNAPYGGGIYNDKGAVSSCRIYLNSANLFGGGIYNYFGTVSACQVNENTCRLYAGGIYNEIGSVSACQIFENSADDGGGVVNVVGNVTDCDIYLNTANVEGGGVLNDYATLVGCNVFNNSASFGGGVYNYYGALAGCNVYKNKSINNGGGIYNFDGTLDTNVIFDNKSNQFGGGVFCLAGALTQCTIAGNSAVDHGSGVYLNNTGEIRNSIIWANEANDVEGDLNCSFSCFREAEGSNGNVFDDPQFFHTEGESDTWDFHLKQGSPCIDSGYSFETETTIDMDGITRPLGNGIDLGAYEAALSLRALFFAEKRHGVAGEVFQFNDASYGNPDSWQWDLDGDGVIDSTEQNPTFRYPASGFYTVSLIVTENGMIDRISKINYIYTTTRFYVKSDGSDENNGMSWADAFQSISKASETALAHDQIWVAAGIYQEGNTITVPENIALYGGFAGYETDLTDRETESNSTIIDGKHTYGCLANFGTIDGFNIRNGRDDRGGGIYNYGGTVSFCLVHASFANSFGGGIYNDEGSISSCRVYNNEAPDNGGGIYNSRGTVSFCRVYSNRALDSGGGIYNDEGVIVASVIYDNAADVQGSGMYSKLGKILNCTIVGNTDGESENGLYLSSWNVRLVNSIIWNDGLDNIYTTYWTHYYHNCYPEADGTYGNISADPMFMNIEGDSSTWDFHLRKGSSCIDAGVIIHDGADTDMDGIARPQGNAIDIGAYEVFLETGVQEATWNMYR